MWRWALREYIQRTEIWTMYYTVVIHFYTIFFFIELTYLLDLFAVIVLVCLFWAVQEWVLHAKALHSETHWFGKDLHIRHHEAPYFHISIGKHVPLPMACMCGQFYLIEFHPWYGHNDSSNPQFVQLNNLVLCIPCTATIISQQATLHRSHWLIFYVAMYHNLFI